MGAASRQLDTRIEIITPENIGFEYRVAGPFRRGAAYLIDLAIRVFALIIIGILLAMAFGGLGPYMAMGVFLVIMFVVDWFYGGFFETVWNGQTPGKYLLRLRVISVTGQPINGWQAVLRNLLRFADTMPVVVVLEGIPIPTFQLGLLATLLNSRFQRAGDMICGTMVVVEEAQPLYGMARVTDFAALQLAGELPADFEASRSLARALSGYVQRRLHLGPSRREEIARHVGEPLRERFGLPLGTSYDVLLCALYHQTFIADRSGLEAGAADGGVSPFRGVKPAVEVSVVG